MPQIVNTKHKVLIQFPTFSKRTWERLSEEDRKVILDGAHEAATAYSKDVLAQEASLQAEMSARALFVCRPFSSQRFGTFACFFGSCIARRCVSAARRSTARCRTATASDALHRVHGGVGERLLTKVE